MTEIADSAKIVPADESLHSQLKFKQFNIRINEELDYIKGLDNEIIDLLDDDLELLSDIKRAGEFRDAVIDVLIQIEECLSKTVVSQKSTPRESTAASKLPKLK